MRREFHVRFCEGGAVRFPSATRLIVLNERHLRRILTSYFRHYHGSRTHLGLDKDCPVPRSVEPPSLRSVSERPMVGGLHHLYFRKAA
jgi:putative transposase